MTEIDRLDRDLTAWFGETAAPRVPEYVDDILRQTAPVRQRPRWTFIERWLPMIVPFAEVSPRRFPLRQLGLVALLIVIVLAAAVAIVASQRRLPNPFGPAGNGAIAHAQDGDIHAVDPVTGVTRPIITGPSVDHAPRYSRDGTRLAFLRQTGAGEAVVVADADGRHQSIVTTEPFAAVDPDGIMWSPDGRSLAVSAVPPGQAPANAQSLFVVDTIDGGIRELAVDYAAIEAYWRPPDGRTLLFQGTRNGRFGLYLVAPEDGTVEALPTAESEQWVRPLGWTPDGKSVLYQLDGGGDGSTTHVLDLSTGTETVLSLGYGHVSNDGRRVAGIEAGRLCISSIDSGPCRQIGDADHMPAGANSQQLFWSPDDRWILTRTSSSDQPALIDTAGGGIAPITWLTSGPESWQRVAP